MSWLASIGLIFGIIGAALFRVPNVPWYRFQQFVYRHSPLVNHYQKVTGIFEYIGNVSLSSPVVIYEKQRENDIPLDISEKTARVLYGALKSTDFGAGCDVEDELGSVVIEGEKITFTFDQEPSYSIPVEESFNRIRLAEDGFLIQYYTGRGAVFLIIGFCLQFVATFPPIQ
jgi:hypothetical protein